MSLTTKANVLIIAPHLSTASDDLWTMVLDDVEISLSASVFGLKTEMAARNWVAHNMTLLADTNTTAPSGPVVKEKVGDVETEFARPSKMNQTDTEYSRTKYGVTFLSIRRSAVVNFSVVVPGV